LSYPSSLLRPPPTPSRLPSTSLASVIGRQAARAADPRPRRASPVPRTTFWPFHALYAGRFLGTRSRFPGAFRGLRPFGTGSAPPCSALSRGPALRRLSGFTLVADRPVATAFMRCRRSASTPRSLSTSGTSYRGPWRLLGPDSHRLAALSLSLGYVMSTSLSSWRPSCWTHPGTAGYVRYHVSDVSRRTHPVSPPATLPWICLGAKGPKPVRRIAPLNYQFIQSHLRSRHR